MNNDVSKITLFDEEGKEIEFDVIVKFDIEDSEYVIVSPVDADEDDIAIALKIVEDENGDELFETVENDAELDMVQEAYDTLFSEEE